MRAQESREIRRSLHRLLQSSGILFVGVELDALLFEKRRFRRQRSGLFVLVGQLPRFDFAGFHVRLIERVDPDDGARHGGGNFPAEKFLAEIVLICSA